MGQNSAFDVDRPDDSGSTNQFMNRKDAKLLVLISAVVCIALIPAYILLKRRADRAVCLKNMQGVMAGMTQYAQDFDDYLPPAYYLGSDGLPATPDRVHAVTWVSIIRPYLPGRITLMCPAATPDEIAYSYNLTGGKPIPSAFGFYLAYSGARLTEVDNPDGVILLTETSNRGANNTYDPKPFPGVKYDGMFIGWDNSNLAPDSKTKAITRLAFQGSGDGDPDKGTGRHDGLLNALSVSNRWIGIGPSSMLTEQNSSTQTLYGLWREPILLRKSVNR